MDTAKDERENREPSKEKIRLRHPLFNIRYPVLLSAAGISGVAIAVFAARDVRWLIILLITAAFFLYSIIFRSSKPAVAVFGICMLLFCFYADSVIKGTERVLTDQKSFNGRVVSYSDDGERSMLIVRSNIAGQSADIAVNVKDGAGKFFYGDDIAVNAEIKPLAEKENEHSFDSRLYNLSRKVSYTAYASYSDVVLSGNSPDILTPVWKAKKSINSLLVSVLPRQDAGIISAMMLGTDEYMEEENRQEFRTVGVAHIFSVSGLHVGIIVAAVTRFLLALSVNRKMRFAVTAVFVGFYCALTAFTPSIVRASVMSLALLFGGMHKRKYDQLSALGCGALLIMSVNPFSIFSVGFQLSFLACLGIVCFAQTFELPKRKFIRSVLSGLMVTLSAQFASFPVMVNSYGNISLIAPVANLIIVPIASCALVIALPVCILCLLIPQLGFLLWIPGGICRLMSYITHMFSAIPGAAAVIPTLPAILVAGYYLLFFALSRFYAVHKPARLVSCLSIVVLTLVLTVPSAVSERNIMKMAVLSVGDGDCTVLTLNGKCLIIDTGSGAYGQEDMSDRGYRELSAYLSGEGITTADVLLTHGDSDHSGGLIRLLEKDEITFGHIYCNYSTIKNAYLKNAISAWGIPTELNAHDRICFDDAVITVLYPPPQSEYRRNLSLAFRVERGNFGALFCGDNQTQDGDEIADIIKTNDMNFDIMFLPHHGSVNTASSKLIEAADADVLIKSTGKAGSEDGAISTAECGQINIFIQRNGAYYIRGYKNEKR